MPSVLRRLWDSPTFTTWGNYAAQSSRLLLVTPLILTQFDEGEIAAWYLFATVNILGTTLSQRLSLTFSRMLAFAMGGASSLAPIKGANLRSENDSPNWDSVGHCYGTIGSLNLFVAIVNILVASALGWYGLLNLELTPQANPEIFVAFGIMQLTSFVLFSYQRFQIALVGMNYVALSNRVAMVFSLISTLAGAVTLALEGGILALTIVMQFFVALGIVRNRFLLRRVEQGRVLSFPSYKIDKKIMRWAWEPTWKGFISQFGLNASTQMTAVIYTSFAGKSEAASLLFAMRMMQTIVSIAQAPFSSAQPHLARMRASGQLGKFRQLVKKRVSLSLGLLTLGIFAAGILFDFILPLIDSNIQFIPLELWVLYGLLVLVVRFDIFCCGVYAIGNYIIFYYDMALAGLVSIVLVFVFSNHLGQLGPIIAATVPLIVILNIRPWIEAKKVNTSQIV